MEAERQRRPFEVIIPGAGAARPGDLASRAGTQLDLRKVADLKSFLKSISLFHELDENQLDRLAAMMRATTFSAGTVLLREGDRGNRFYVIVSGEVDVFAAPSGSTKKRSSVRRRSALDAGKRVGVLAQGGYFGVTALLHTSGQDVSQKGRHVLKASKGEVECMTLSRRDFNATLSDLRTLMSVGVGSDDLGATVRGSADDDASSLTSTSRHETNISTRCLEAHVSAFSGVLHLAPQSYNVYREKDEMREKESGASSPSRDGAAASNEDEVRRVPSLAQLMGSLSPGMDASAILDKVTNVLCTIVNADRLHVLLLDGAAWTGVRKGGRGKGEIRLTMIGAAHRSDDSSSAAADDNWWRWSESLAVHVARTGRSVNTADAHTCPIFDKSEDMVVTAHAKGRVERTHAMACVAIPADPEAGDPARGESGAAPLRVFGVIQASNKRVEGGWQPFSESDMATLDMCARQLTHVFREWAPPAIQPLLRFLALSEQRARTLRTQGFIDEEEEGEEEEQYMHPRPSHSVATKYRVRLRRVAPAIASIASRFAAILPRRKSVLQKLSGVHSKTAASSSSGAASNPITTKKRSLKSSVKALPRLRRLLKRKSSAKAGSPASSSEQGLQLRACVAHGDVALSDWINIPLTEDAIGVSDPPAAASLPTPEWCTLDMAVASLPRGGVVLFELRTSYGEVLGVGRLRVWSYESTLRRGRIRLHLMQANAAGNASDSDFELHSVGAHAATVAKRFDLLNDAAVEGASSSVDARAHDLLQWIEVELGAEEVDLAPLQRVQFALPQNRSTQTQAKVTATSADAALKVKRIMDTVRGTQTPTRMECDAVWQHRRDLMKQRFALPVCILSLPYGNAFAVVEMHSLMQEWAAPGPLELLQLLGRRFPDPAVRLFAVECLQRLSDAALLRYMLQLTQTLRFEPYADSALARFLLRRALASPATIGHVFFWSLKAEMRGSDPGGARLGRENLHHRRVVLLLQHFLSHCGAQRQALGHETFVVRKLAMVQSTMQLFRVAGGGAARSAPPSSEAQRELQQSLASVTASFPSEFQVPIFPGMHACGVDVASCKVLDSKMRPLLLSFKFSGGASKKCLFKCGDDLRQDQLTLQLLSAMRTIWERAEAAPADMRMTIYGVCATGARSGFIEIVSKCKTIASIVIDAAISPASPSAAGSAAAASAAKSPTGRVRRASVRIHNKARAAHSALHNDDAIANWLKERCAVSGAIGYDAAAENFRISCAAYCVATYVLGIGDRHPSNIMLTEDGRLFHIDFGHILGNKKSKRFGGVTFNREPAPFLLTPAMALVISHNGGWDEFVQLACRLFVLLRRDAGLLCTLFRLMLCCGLPELTREADITWIERALLLGGGGGGGASTATEDDAAAATHFEELIYKSLRTKATQVNDAFHMLKHVM